MDSNFIINGEILEKYIGPGQNVVVPEGVTEIGQEAFANNKKIKSVTLPKSIKVISDFAFFCCENLEEVKNLKNVTFVGKNAFFNCRKLSSLEKLKNLIHIGKSAFESCDSISSITIGEDLLSVGNSAFSFCSNLKSVTLPIVADFDGGHFFKGCNNLETLIFLDGFEELGSFDTLTNVKTIVLPDSLRKIKESTFCDFISLESVSLPKNLESIGGFAFFNCRSLKNITIPEKVKILQNETFKACVALESVVLSDGLEKICQSAFCRCESLKSIVIPNTVTTIEKHAFHGCSDLESVVLSDGLLTIHKDVFHSCKSLKSINIPKNLRKINDNAFKDCFMLEKIKLPDTLLEINNFAFSGCFSLEEIILPKSLTLIGNNAFSRTALKKIEFPVSLKIIKNGVCSDCFNLETVKMSEKIVSIGEKAFSDCKNLSKIIFEKDNSRGYFDKFNAICELAFKGCKKLEEFVVPETIGTLSSSAFYNCVNLKKIVIGKNMSIIGFATFYNCVNLTDIRLDSENRFFDLIQNRIFVKRNDKRLIHMICENDCTDTIAIPEIVRDTRGSTYVNTKGIKKIIVPETMDIFSTECNFQFPDIEELRLPDSLHTLLFGARQPCEKIKCLKIPDNVNVLKFDPFLFKGHNFMANCYRVAFHNAKIVFNNSIPQQINQLQEAVLSTFIESPELFSGFGIINWTKRLLDSDYDNKTKAKFVTELLSKQLISAEYLDEFREIVKDFIDTEMNALFLSEANRLKKELEKERKRKISISRGIIEKMLHGEKMCDLKNVTVSFFGYRANFDTMKDFAKCVEEHGGIFSETVDENTDLLVTNRKNFVSEKIEFAKRNKIPIMNEIEFMNFLGKGSKLNFLLMDEYNPRPRFLSSIEIPKGVSTICSDAVYTYQFEKVFVPEGVLEMREGCIHGDSATLDVFLPSSLVSIHPEAIRIFNKNSINTNCTKPEMHLIPPNKIRIHAKKNSEGHKFAVANNYSFVEEK